MEPKKILIFGRGQLGTFYKDHFESKGVEVATPKVDIRNLDAVREAVTEACPDVVVNCAAKTNIDWCEQNKTEAFEVNTLGADNVAAAADEAGKYLLHISSGCVQESLTADDVKNEEDKPNPLCYYSWTKVWAENLIEDRAIRRGLKALVLRPRQLLSSMASPRNAFVKMLTYSKFIDTPNSCTVVEDLMDATWRLLEQDATGLVNVVNPGVTSPYRIAMSLKELIKPDMEIERISKDELNSMTLAKRIDAVLSTDRLEGYGIMLRPVDERLPEIVAMLKENLARGSGKEIMDKTAAETKEKLALVS